MLNQIQELSSNMGIGYFLMYESQETQQKAIKYSQQLSKEKLIQIVNKLEQAEQKYNSDSANLQQISRSGKSKSQINIEINKCLTMLRQQIKSRQSQSQNLEVEMRTQNKKGIKNVFNLIKLTVIGVLVFLFTMSLFSNNDWSDERDSIRESQQIQNYENSQIDESQTLKYYDDLQQTSSSYVTDSVFESQDKYESLIDEQKLEQSGYHNLQNKKINQTASTPNNYFSDYIMIQQPLAFSYKILTIFIPQSVAHFICSYVLFFIFWIIAIVLNVL